MFDMADVSRLPRLRIAKPESGGWGREEEDEAAAAEAEAVGLVVDEPSLLVVVETMTSVDDVVSLRTRTGVFVMSGGGFLVD